MRSISTLVIAALALIGVLAARAHTARA